MHMLILFLGNNNTIRKNTELHVGMKNKELYCRKGIEIT